MNTSIETILGQLKSANVTAEALVIQCIEHIERHNPQINAVTELLQEQALEQARQIDNARHRGAASGPLAGLPVLIKENIDVASAVCSAGLPLLNSYRS